MAWLRVVREFEFDFRPEAPVCRVYRPASDPIEVPQKVADFAIAHGCGEAATDLDPAERRAVRRRKAG